MRLICLLLLLPPLLGRLHAQTMTGRWEGTLQHHSCVGSRNIAFVSFDLQPEGDAHRATISYSALPLADTFALTPLIFDVRAVVYKDRIGIRYQAGDERFGRRDFAIGYVAGRYHIDLQYTETETEELLEGSYWGSNGGRGYIRLSRTKPGVRAKSENASAVLARLRARQLERKSAEAKQQRMELEQNLIRIRREEAFTSAARESRKTMITDTIRLSDTGSIRFALFDNGMEDQDSVSIFLDAELLLHRRKVTNTPLEFAVTTPADGRPVLLTFVAENLGSIPPNTAMLRVRTALRDYLLPVTSDLQTNRGILLQWIRTER